MARATDWNILSAFLDPDDVRRPRRPPENQSVADCDHESVEDDLGGIDDIDPRRFIAAE